MQLPIPTDSSYRDARRLALSQHPRQIGLDYIEVVAGAGATAWQLRVHFVPPAAAGKRPTPTSLTADNIRIADAAGAPARDLRIEIAPLPADEQSTIVTLMLYAGAGPATDRPAGYVLA